MWGAKESPNAPQKEAAVPGPRPEGGQQADGSGDRVCFLATTWLSAWTVLPCKYQLSGSTQHTPKQKGISSHGPSQIQLQPEGQQHPQRHRTKTS